MRLSTSQPALRVRGSSSSRRTVTSGTKASAFARSIPAAAARRTAASPSASSARTATATSSPPFAAGRATTSAAASRTRRSACRAAAARAAPASTAPDRPTAASASAARSTVASAPAQAAIRGARAAAASGIAEERVGPEHGRERRRREVQRGPGEPREHGAVLRPGERAPHHLREHGVRAPGERREERVHGGKVPRPRHALGGQDPVVERLAARGHLEERLAGAGAGHSSERPQRVEAALECAPRVVLPLDEVLLVERLGARVRVRLLGPRGAGPEEEREEREPVVPARARRGAARTPAGPPGRRGDSPVRGEGADRSLGGASGIPDSVDGGGRCRRSGPSLPPPPGPSRAPPGSPARVRPRRRAGRLLPGGGPRSQRGAVLGPQ